MTQDSEHNPIVVGLDELQNGIDYDILQKAFGPDSLGIILVKDLPQHFHKLRLEVLQSASVLANLPEEDLNILESEESIWLTGWSCGKEKLASSGKPDFNKGSFYVNCAFHNDSSLEGPLPELVERFQDYKAYTTPNLWPKANAGLESFESNLKELCNFIIDVAGSVAANCDKYIKSVYESYSSDFLQRVVRDSTCTKARLLHYFPSKQAQSNSIKGEDDWCGEHLDHSCLTGLTSALFIDESKGLTYNLDKSPDELSGLYIRDRNNNVVKVNIPPDCLAFQSGSTLQEVSKGGFKAVPHYVKGTSLPSIARNTLAVFCQPDLDEPVNENENFAEYSNRILKGNH
ncbi:uncharacterized protein RJT21DRAFT_122142 [Scheffersomyces amazonensis]|uniref:uncharacterized protein n=1 Tax=Scheffersomyces amazonensis TaxID=1078765 RepID=UPI00315D8336